MKNGLAVQYKSLATVKKIGRKFQSTDMWGRIER